MLTAAVAAPADHSAFVDQEQAVARRYSAGAQQVEAALCCPVDYDPRFLAAIPSQVLERDYGCGDPSRYVTADETVLDLGSGTGKICFIASQVVGPSGRVIGVDVNDDMLAVARAAAPAVAERVGHGGVEFRKARIQDLAVDLDTLQQWLAAHPVNDLASLAALEAEQRRLRVDEPLVADDSIDVVLSNCVLNLVATEQKTALFAEIFRVLRRGGRAVISDIVASTEVPEQLRADPELWSGCISGALQEEAFLAAFERAGFHGIHLVTRGSAPWQVVEGIEFRAVTVVAYKGKDGACRDHGQAVIYPGPFKAVLDDDGHLLHRGVPSAVCAKTFQLYAQAPYVGLMQLLEPARPVDPATAPPFACTPPGTLTHNPAVPTARRDLAGLTSQGGDPVTACC
ncbi:MAG: methyltransferase domain-containing protein [Pseudonocardia sp.]|uniref:methyltransferase domain-containing protein n=1 Tax=Pseudonocardia sp. TaxID=60912 RepID=UPI001AC76E07|nr:methyltransferase domain-containing protein [Pseudonocardia sp.]MBN9098175.1 methyltransferase domain-containing protein [Pseudonocardia sp.]